MSDSLPPAKSYHGFILRCDADGRILSVVRDDFGLPDEISPGAVLTALFDPQSIQKFLSFLHEVRTARGAYNWQMNILHGKQAIPLVFTGLLSGSDCYLIGYRTDDPSHVLYEELLSLNNELVTLQRDLQKKNTVLQQAAETKNTFLGMVAHDMRNPLGSFSGLCRMLLDGLLGPVTGEQHEAIGMMKKSADFMLEMVNDLLDFSAIDAGKLTLKYGELEFIPFLESIVRLNRVASEQKGIAMKLEIADELRELRFRCDGLKIEQVLNNLISNAIKFSHSGTEISLRIERSEREVVVTVKDQGQGIPPEEMSRLFTAFGRTSVRSTDGERSTGLGLLISRKIVEGHGGRIRVESTPGAGSSFSFTLPLETES